MTITRSDPAIVCGGRTRPRHRASCGRSRQASRIARASLADFAALLSRPGVGSPEEDPAIDQSTPGRAAWVFRRAGRPIGLSPSASSRSTSRDPAGSSTTHVRSGIHDRLRLRGTAGRWACAGNWIFDALGITNQPRARRSCCVGSPQLRRGTTRSSGRIAATAARCDTAQQVQQRAFASQHRAGLIRNFSRGKIECSGARVGARRACAETVARLSASVTQVTSS